MGYMKSKIKVLLISIISIYFLYLLPTIHAKEKEANAKKEKQSWDDTWHRMPHKNVSLDVHEGTWMSLDVSPDGQWIVFDLLGQIYQIPVQGGEAKVLYKNHAWQMQPVYSPDGQYIAFTSDLNGGDNLWVMTADGKTAWAVSEEKERLVNSPTWTPDGTFVAGRKHFTNRRSLGAGEIWMYAWQGKTKGIKMTRKNSDQKDEGEPAFSPDGMWVYQSYDSTAGSHFEYNKNSHQAIYAIRRINRHSGETDVLIQGAGGAARPTPSPDRKSIAFIRRVEGKTTLWVKSLHDGVERKVADHLSRDLQETWAIHGVYPHIAWTPDSKRIIYWADGEIHWVDVSHQTRGKIPFHVKDQRRIVDSLKFKVNVYADQFQPKMLRNMQRYGNRVLFESMGTIYLAHLNEQTQDVEKIHAIVHSADYFAFQPHFTPDGKGVLYIRWHDQELSKVYLYNLSHQSTRILTPQAGHYRSPRLSPNQQWLVYQRVASGWLTSPRFSQKRGLYALNLQTNKERKIAADGYHPHWLDTSDRIYFTTQQGKEQHLQSELITGGDRHTHARGKNLQWIRYSPNRQWIAFQSAFKVYVSAAPASAIPLELSSGMKSSVLFPLSQDSGFEPHWSHQSDQISWSLGHELYTQSISTLVKQRSAIQSKDQDQDQDSIPIRKTLMSFKVPQAKPDLSHIIAFIGGRMITMNQDQVIENGIVMIQGNQIIAVGEYQDLIQQVPKTAHRIDIKGKTVIPGLIDAHAHASYAAHGVIPQYAWPLAATLAFGVTTLFDPSHHSQAVFACSEMLKAGRIVGPRVFSTGTILYGAGGPSKADIQTLDDAKYHLKRMQSMGAWSVKSYNQPRRDQRQKLLYAARQLKMQVVPEGGSLFHHNMTHIIDGHTKLEHAVPLEKLYEDVIQLWQASQVGYTPTFNVAYGGIMGENYWYQESPVYQHTRLRAFVPTRELDARARRPFTAPLEDWNHINVAKSAWELRQRGVRVHAGAHGQRNGLGMHWEMWSMQQGGFTELEALKAATVSVAEDLGLDHVLGKIDVGYLADLVVIDGNPLKNLRQSEQVRWTMINGVLYDAISMEQRAPHLKSWPKLFFQIDGEGNDQKTKNQSSCSCIH